MTENIVCRRKIKVKTIWELNERLFNKKKLLNKKILNLNRKIS